MIDKDIMYGPGNDNYGRDTPEATAKRLERLSEAVKNIPASDVAQAIDTLRKSKEDKPMTTPLTPDEERKLAEAVFPNHLFHGVSGDRVYIRYDSYADAFHVDYTSNPDHWRRLVVFACRRVQEKIKGKNRFRERDHWHHQIGIAVSEADTESLKRMALELIP